MREEVSEWPAIQLPLLLSSHSAHIVRVRFDLPHERWSTLTDVLSDDERAKAARFRFDEPRRQFIMCRAILKILLANCCRVETNRIQLEYGAHGKPALSLAELPVGTPAMEFSVSHSGRFGLIAVSLKTPIGVDIEAWNPAVKHQRLAERFFAPTEVIELSKLPLESQLAGFYRCWTSKEAYLKATGRGLSLPLDSFCVSADPVRPAALVAVDDHPAASHDWTAQSLTVSHGYSATVMIAQSPCEFACWEWASD